MSFEWKNYVYLAEELSKRQEEACLRSSMSRAYYGVFCIARNEKWLRDYKPEKDEEEGIHQKVINKYKDSSDVIEQRIGSFLDRLRRLRNIADYDENKLINRDFAERSVEGANHVLNYMGITRTQS